MDLDIFEDIYEGILSNYSIPSMKNYVSVMIWASITSHVVGHFNMLEGNINAVKISGSCVDRTTDFDYRRIV